MKKYHFKPARLGVFAIYYPATVLGWIITLALLSLFIFLFTVADQKSHSASDTLFSFSPWAITIMLFFDMLCFRIGEYPRWWKHKSKK